MKTGLTLLLGTLLAWAGPAFADLKFAWDAPLAYENGAPLDPAKDLIRYRLWRDNAVRANISSPGVGVAPPTEYTYTTFLAPGTYVFEVSAVDRNGTESKRSNALTVTIQPTPTPIPTVTPTATPRPVPRSPEVFRIEGQ